MTGHLGDRVAAVADDRLGLRDREAALAHLVGCTPCREAVAAQRDIRRRLAGMNQPAPAADLVERLRVLGASPQVAAGAVRSTSHAVPMRRAVAGVASVLAIGVGTAYVAGGGGESGNPVQPPVATFVSQHGTGSGAATLNDPAVSAVTASYHP